MFDHYGIYLIITGVYELVCKQHCGDKIVVARDANDY